MSTARRHLGTGPSVTSSIPTDPAPRLLAAERVEPNSLLDGREDVVVRKGRRPLGQGIERPFASEQVGREG